MQLPNRCEVWMTSLKTYVENAVKVIEQLFIEDNKGYSMKNKVKNPFPQVIDWNLMCQMS